MSAFSSVFVHQARESSKGRSLAFRAGCRLPVKAASLTVRDQADADISSPPTTPCLHHPAHSHPERSHCIEMVWGVTALACPAGLPAVYQVRLW